VNDPTAPFAAAAGAGIFLFLLWLALSAAVIAFGLWLTYTVIWRAVRRGMREFHYPSKQWVQKR
jgi:hypothetical protein